MGRCGWDARYSGCSTRAGPGRCLAAHFGLHYLDLLACPTHAVGVLHGSTLALRPSDIAVPAAVAQPAPAALFPAEPVTTAAAAVVPARAALHSLPREKHSLTLRLLMREVEQF
ncbi:hypothetical protein [Streptomyces sp. NPDC090112]|uniref:hypothetical protein n=1 Tax=Streptomyces sp. NPDC090112 TaxID=3365949 RepID=UPI00381DC679